MRTIGVMTVMALFGGTCAVAQGFTTSPCKPRIATQPTMPTGLLVAPIIGTSPTSQAAKLSTYAANPVQANRSSARY